MPIDILHNFFFFLGTDLGEFLKRVFELVLFTLVTYMATSEYIKSKKHELKYLIVGFGLLAFQKLVMVLLMGYFVFAQETTAYIRAVLLVAEHTLEIFALILLVNAFVFPLFRKRTRKLKQYIVIEVLLLLLIAIIIEALWFFVFSSGSRFQQYVGNGLFMLIKIIVLLIPVFYITKHIKKDLIRYPHDIILAFSVYSITPIIQFINFIFFNNESAKLIVAGHPFPFIATILFVRIMYLKLVDKAFLKKQLKQTEERYQHEKEISEMKDSFISTVSHELRTPLTSMKLYLSLLKNEKLGGMNKKQKESLHIVEQENNRLSKLINDILDLSKLEAGKEKLNLKKFKVHDLVNDKIYTNIAKDQKIKLIKKIPKNMIIEADYDKMKQVFINLYNNAIKFTDKKGKIWISAKNLKDKYQFSIKDNGKGIEKEKIPKLFNKFYQTENFMIRKEKGSGLGLAIVKKIVDLHNGNIYVESKLNKGSEFIVEIPK